MIEGWKYDVINKVPFSYKDGIGGSKLYLVHTKQEWEAFFDVLMGQKLVAWDTETSGFQYYKNDRIVGSSFGWEKDHFYIPIRHEDSLLGGKQPPQLPIDFIKEDLRTFFSQRNVFLIGHNFKFDRHFLKADGIDILNPFHDTTFSWQIYDENAPNKLKSIASGWVDMLGKRHKGLIGPEANAKEKELAQWRRDESKARRTAYSRMVMSRADELAFELEHQDKNRVQLKKWIIDNELANHPYRTTKVEDIHYGFVPIELMVEYAATDTFLTYALHKKMMESITFDEDTTKLYTNELKLCKVLYETEEKGALIDSDYLKDFEKELSAECDFVSEKIYKQIGRRINLNSSDQLVAALQEQGATFTKTTKTGKFSLDVEVLEKLKDDYPLAEDVLFLRGSDKILNTYVRAIQRTTEFSPYVHMNFNQNVTTGRMSCSDPNLQNIPRNDTRIRRAFICPEGYYFIFADYSQVEVRLVAHYSEDPLMLDAYSKGQDIHSRTACEMFAIPYTEMVEVLKNEDHENYKVFKEYRNTAKTINFGIIYGVGAPGLSRQIERPDRYIGVPDSVWIGACQDYIDQYFEKYRYVRRFINKCKRLVKKNASIPNYFGRVRHLPHINAWKDLGKEYSWMSGKAERQAANFVIQSTAADVFKFATVRVAEEVFKGTQSHIVNLVHDEIQSYVHQDELHLLNKKKEVMEDFDFKVPLLAEFGYSTSSWAEKRGL